MVLLGKLSWENGDIGASAVIAGTLSPAVPCSHRSVSMHVKSPVGNRAALLSNLYS